MNSVIFPVHGKMEAMCVCVYFAMYENENQKTTSKSTSTLEASLVLAFIHEKREIASTASCQKRMN